jgi:aminoglycoside 3-N-acetyltransferase I
MKRLGPQDLAAMRCVNALFAEAFDDPEHYASALPDDGWLGSLLANPDCIALAAYQGEQIVGGLTGYVLRKFEQARTEIYIYDLAVRAESRRSAVATALIEALQPIARAAGAWVIYVQADLGDEPASALYAKLGSREVVLHFDIDVRPTG